MYNSLIWSLISKQDRQFKGDTKRKSWLFIMKEYRCVFHYPLVWSNIRSLRCENQIVCTSYKSHKSLILLLNLCANSCKETKRRKLKSRVRQRTHILVTLSNKNIFRYTIYEISRFVYSFSTHDVCWSYCMARLRICVHLIYRTIER